MSPGRRSELEGSDPEKGPGRGRLEGLKGRWDISRGLGVVREKGRVSGYFVANGSRWRRYKESVERLGIGCWPAKLK